MTIAQILAVGGGAALGAWLRWGLGLAFNGAILPAGTLIANLLGGFLAGVVIAYFVDSSPQDVMRLFLMTGFLGGLTTFSAFSAEAFGLLNKQEYWWAVAHISSHVVGSLCMTALGFALVHFVRQ
jgi:fluoride exporter